MFSNLGLFARQPCPDGACLRPRCIFNHSGSSQSSASAEDRSLKRQRSSAATSVSTAKVASSSTPRIPATVGSSATPALLRSRQPLMGTTAQPASTNSVPPKSRAASAHTPTSSSMPIFPRTSRQPAPDRQNAWRKLLTQFDLLYSDISGTHPDLARESATEQEREISESSGNLKVYKSAIHHAAVQISRRPKPDRVPHTSIGTVKQSKAATEAAAVAKASRLSIDNLKQYCLSKDDFSKWGYPDPNNAELQHPSNPIPPGGSEGTRQVCDRCKVEFVVSPSPPSDCRYHSGRVAPERVEGRRKWIYSCCKLERGSAGCQEGHHVFADRENDEKLAARVPYRYAADLRDSSKAEQYLDVLGLDCEMIYTTDGSSLARATFVDDNGKVVLDEHVRQKSAVLDYNTRFSGISAEDLTKAVMTLEDVRAAAAAFIGPNTILVGHGLENDLRALRLLHPNVIDTAILFPHDKGAPYRRALRDLVKEKLGYFIQDRTADAGHSSAEDASATLDLLKWRVREDGQ